MDDSSKTLLVKEAYFLDTRSSIILILDHFLTYLCDVCDPKILGLDICSDSMVGDAMKRGISGGQKKRLTTGCGYALLDCCLIRFPF